MTVCINAIEQNGAAAQVDGACGNWEGTVDALSINAKKSLGDTQVCKRKCFTKNFKEQNFSRLTRISYAFPMDHENRRQDSAIRIRATASALST